MPSTDEDAIVPVAHYAVDRVVKGLWIVRGRDVDFHFRHRALKAVASQDKDGRTVQGRAKLDKGKNISGENFCEDFSKVV